LQELTWNATDHERMPVLLSDPADFETWLSGSTEEACLRHMDTCCIGHEEVAEWQSHYHAHGGASLALLGCDATANDDHAHRHPAITAMKPVWWNPADKVAVALSSEPKAGEPVSSQDDQARQ
jgi:hypothetical protein